MKYYNAYILLILSVLYGNMLVLLVLYRIIPNFSTVTSPSKITKLICKQVIHNLFWNNFIFWSSSWTKQLVFCLLSNYTLTDCYMGVVLSEHREVCSVWSILFTLNSSFADKKISYRARTQWTKHWKNIFSFLKMLPLNWNASLTYKKHT